MVKFLLLFCGLLVNSDYISNSNQIKNEDEIFLKIKDTKDLSEVEKKEFIRLLNDCSMYTFFSTADDIKRFLMCNTFCKNFLFEDIKFSEYKTALILISKSQINQKHAVEYYILWSSFYRKKFNKELSEDEYKRYLKIAAGNSIYSNADFLNLVEWNKFYNKIFFKDISIEEIKAINSFINFFKSRSCNLNEEELLKIVYVFLYIGSTKIWKIQNALEDDLNFEKFKKILLIIYSWGGEFHINWSENKTLENLLKANEIYLSNKQRLSYDDFENITIRLLSCPNIKIEQLLCQYKTKKTGPILEKKSNKQFAKKVELERKKNKIINEKKDNLSKNLVEHKMVIKSEEELKSDQIERIKLKSKEGDQEVNNVLKEEKIENANCKKELFSKDHISKFVFIICFFVIAIL